MYMLKDKYPKGADRLCTILYWLRKVKWGNTPCRSATKLADNYVENKNNVLFALCSELVMRGWFREVEMLFGPVGHTHNGNDAYHCCHNQLVGNHEAVTLNEYIGHFSRAWHSERTRPLPIINTRGKSVMRDCYAACRTITRVSTMTFLCAPSGLRWRQEDS